MNLYNQDGEHVKLPDKGWPRKNVQFPKFVYSISQLIQHRIFKILVSTPHNQGGIMGGRHKNFEDPMWFELRNRVNKLLKLYIFFGPPFKWNQRYIYFFNSTIHTFPCTTKGWPNKNVQFDKFVYSISQFIQHRIFKILVSTPHNTPINIGGRHKNFEDPMMYGLKYRVHKFLKLFIFSGPGQDRTMVSYGCPAEPCEVNI